MNSPHSSVRFLKNKNLSDSDDLGGQAYKTDSVTDFPPLPTSCSVIGKDDKRIILDEFQCDERLKYSENVNHRTLARNSDKEQCISFHDSHKEAVKMKIESGPKRKNKQSEKNCPQFRQISSFKIDEVSNKLVLEKEKLDNELPKTLTLIATANTETVPKLRSRNKKKKDISKLNKHQESDKINSAAPEMHSSSNEVKSASLSAHQVITDLSSREEYPELASFPSTHLPNPITQPKGRAKVKFSGIAAISSGISSYGWTPTHSFSDILKATTVPASSLKVRSYRTMVSAESSKSASLFTGSSVQTDEKCKKAEMISCSQIDSGKIPDVKRSKVPETNKTQKKPASTHLNLSDFFLQMNSNQKIRKRRQVKFKHLEKKLESYVGTPHNTLDSTAPLRKRGKERELPKKKHLSTLKKIILKERELKKKILSETFTDPSHQDKELLLEEVPTNDDITSLCDVSPTDTATIETDLEKDVTNSPIINSSITTEKSDDNSLEVNKQRNVAKQMLHGRKFREYCDHLVSQDIDNLLSSLLKELVRFQDRLHQKNPIKAKTKKRMVCGLKEVTKHLKMKRIKAIVVTPDVERIHSEGGLDDMLTTLLKLATEHCIPCVFGLNRKKIGGILKKKVPISCVGILNYEGTEEIYKQLMEKVQEARIFYKKYLENLCELLKPEVIDSLSEPLSVQEKQELWKRFTANDSKLDFGEIISQVQTEE